MLWVGGAALLTAFVLPAAQDEADVAYLRRLIWARNLPRYLNGALAFALLSGLTMYANLAVLTHGAWARSRVGLTLGLGGALAIAAALVATFVAAPAIHRALTLTDSAATTGAATTPAAAEDGEVAGALRRYAAAMRLVVVLLLGTAALMAVARYV